MTPRGRGGSAPELTPREALFFEAGIKLGGIFHQYLGTPVSAETAKGLGDTIAAAVSLQPFVERVRVKIDVQRGGPVGRGRFAYRYLTPEMLDVRVTLAAGRARVVAAMSYRADLRYPLMHVVSAHPAVGRRKTPRRKD
jgi:hypothetical protein